MKAQGLLIKALSLCLAVILLVPSLGIAADKDKKEDKKAYEFTTESIVKHTPVKNQYWTGTCWCFATVSFLESEALRMDKGELDLSEMFIVRHTYPRKASNYIRLHGKANFSQGGQSHDVLNIVRDYGLALEKDYNGMRINEKRHNHSEMISVMSSMMDALLKGRGRKLTPRWMQALEAVLDVYLGKPVENFKYNGKTTTPKAFAKSIGIDPDNYVEFTSYSIYPFYQKCRLEIPDNWDYNRDYYNVPIDDLERIADHALKNGYSIAWDGDVSEKEFSSRETGVAVVPVIDYEDKTKEQKNEKPTEPVKEKEITQDMRQETFDNFTTTDDHLMHVVGLSHDQNGAKYYYTKNSGGTVDRAYDGFVYLSRPYFRLKTTALMVHKDAIPKDLKKKLNIK